MDITKMTDETKKEEVKTEEVKLEEVTTTEAPIDYNTEYINHKRCYKCQRVTEGIEAFQSVSKNGKVRTCKTCNKCRGCVKASLKKYREPTLKEKNAIYKKFIMLSSQATINDNLENMTDEEKNIILKMLN